MCFWKFIRCVIGVFVLFTLTTTLVSCEETKNRTVAVYMNKSKSSQGCSKKYEDMVLKSVLERIIEGDELILSEFDGTGVKSFKKLNTNVVNGKNLKKEIEQALLPQHVIEGTPMGAVLSNIEKVAKEKKDELVVIVAGDGFDEHVAGKKQQNFTVKNVKDFNEKIVSLSNTVVSFVFLNPDKDTEYKEKFKADNVLFFTSNCSSFSDKPDKPSLEKEDKDAIEQTFQLLDTISKPIENKNKKGDK